MSESDVGKFVIASVEITLNSGRGAVGWRAGIITGHDRGGRPKLIDVLGREWTAPLPQFTVCEEIAQRPNQREFVERWRAEHAKPPAPQSWRQRPGLL